MSHGPHCRVWRHPPVNREVPMVDVSMTDRHIELIHQAVLVSRLTGREDVVDLLAGWLFDQENLPCICFFARPKPGEFMVCPICRACVVAGPPPPPERDYIPPAGEENFPARKL